MRGRLLVAGACVVGVLAGLPACRDTPEMPLVTERYTIARFNLDPAGGATPESEFAGLSPRPAGDVIMKKIRFFVADATGRELDLERDGVHLHHVVMMSSKSTDAACPDSGYTTQAVWILGLANIQVEGLHRFAASGNEKTPISLPFTYGYHVGAGDTWVALWHLMNVGTERRDGLQLGYEIAYQRPTGSEQIVPRDVTPYYLDVAGCTSSDFDLPGGGAPGSVATKTAMIPMPRAGRAVMTLGHLHDGGIDVSWIDPSGQPRCTATSTYGAAHGHGADHHAWAGGTISSISACHTYFDVGAGETWTVSARYPGDAAFKDAMGVIFTYLAE